MVQTRSRWKKEHPCVVNVVKIVTKRVESCKTRQAPIEMLDTLFPRVIGDGAREDSTIIKSWKIVSLQM